MTSVDNESEDDTECDSSDNSEFGEGDLKRAVTINVMMVVVRMIMRLLWVVKVKEG